MTETRPTWTEAWRHECEVRHVASLTPERRRDYCKGVAQARGREVATRLWRETRAREAREA